MTDTVSIDDAKTNLSKPACRNFFQPRSGCVSLKLCKAWIFVHQSPKPSTLKTTSLSGVSET